MKLLYALLPLLSAIALAQDVVEENCVCPEVRCIADDALALCNCLNNRETLCKKRCPRYEPTYRPCPATPIATATRTPKSSLGPKPTTKPKTCECPLVNCIQSWPESCYCANGAAQRCYDRCGGAPPTLQECPAEDPVPESLPFKPVTCQCPQVFCAQVWPQSCYCANAAAQDCYNKCGGAPPSLQSCPIEDVVVSEPVPELGPEAETKCKCDEIACIQVWPQSCYCANAAAEQCHKKCGGKKPKLQTCPPQITSTLATRVKPAKSSKCSTTKPTSTLPPNPHKVCGGGRANYLLCDEGYTCIDDPYTPGCGPSCDGLGICVRDQICGGFAGFECEEQGQVCHDDPRDDCDANSGGADCAGLCVWPHRSLTEGL